LLLVGWEILMQGVEVWRNRWEFKGIMGIKWVNFKFFLKNMKSFLLVTIKCNNYLGELKVVLFGFGLGLLWNPILGSIPNEKLKFYLKHYSHVFFFYFSFLIFSKNSFHSPPKKHHTHPQPKPQIIPNSTSILLFFISFLIFLHNCNKLNCFHRLNKFETRKEKLYLSPINKSKTGKV